MSEIQGRPEVGSGVTLHSWSDSHAYTVVKVSESGRTIWIQRDSVKRLNADDDQFFPGGFVGTTTHPKGQLWEYRPDPSAPLKRAYLGKRGWRCEGERVSAGRFEHYDYNF